MSDKLVIQERMDAYINSMSEELHQICSQSQEDGAKMTVMSLQLCGVISLVEERSRVVGTDLEEVNGHFDYHRGEINCLKKREEELKGLIIGAGHEANIFKTWLDQMKEKACKCEHTPSEVAEELSLEEDTRTKLSYASARASKYVAPPVENPIVRKLDLSHLCFSLNFYFLMFLHNFPLCFLH